MGKQTTSNSHNHSKSLTYVKEKYVGTTVSSSRLCNWLAVGVGTISAGLICWCKIKKYHDKRVLCSESASPLKKSEQEHDSKTLSKKMRHSNITPALVDKWKSLAKEGVSRSEIAEKFNVSVNTVNNHLKAKTYKRAKKHE